MKKKPTWNESPTWANYLAQDQSGCWYWYEKRPIPCLIEWLSCGGRVDIAHSTGFNKSWRSTLEIKND